MCAVENIEMSLEFVYSNLCIHTCSIIILVHGLCNFSELAGWINSNFSEFLLVTSWTYHNGLNLQGLCDMLMFLCVHEWNSVVIFFYSLQHIVLSSHEQHDKVLYLYQVAKDLLILSYGYAYCQFFFYYFFVKLIALIFLYQMLLVNYLFLGWRCMRHASI